MADPRTPAPDSSAVRVALWRALHVEHDAPPHVLEDAIDLKLAAPNDGWRRRPDMNPEMTSRARASIVARARFIEDLVAQQADRVAQYVILGAGLDSFAQRRPEIASLAPGSTLVASFMPPAELLDPDELPLRQGTERGARAAGTPMISFFTPQEIVALARDCGFQEARHVSAADLTKRYFYRRTDGLRPSGSEEILMATT